MKKAFIITICIITLGIIGTEPATVFANNDIDVNSGNKM